MSTPARQPRQSFIGTGTSTPSRPPSSQSFLPQPSGSGIPTPSASSRRKSSLGPSTPTHGAGANGGSPHYADDDEDANRALAEAMRVRPPSSVGSSTGMSFGSGSVYGSGTGNGGGTGSYGRASARGLTREDVSTPPPQMGQRQLSNDPTSFSTPPYPSSLRQSALRAPHAPTTPGISTPKTPINGQAAARARIASTALGRSTLGNNGAGPGIGQGTPTTPSSKRTVSAYTPGGGLAGGGGGMGRRVSAVGLGNSSMRPPAPPRTPTSASLSITNGGKTPPARSPVPPHASSTPTTAGGPSSQRAKQPWTPEVGDDVRIASMGFEGVLRYKGPVKGKSGDAVFGGVELFEGFKGRGRNNGEVGDDKYFETSDLRGLFVPIAKLARATVNPARAPSSASTYRSTTSSANNNGRATPAFSVRSGASGRETPFISEAEDEDYAGGEGDKTMTMTVTPSKPTATTRTTNGQASSSAAGWTAKVPPVPGSRMSTGGPRTGSVASIAGMSSAQLAARRALAQSEASLSASQAGPVANDRLRESVASTTTTTATTPKAARLPRRSEIGSSLTPGPSTHVTPSRSVSVSASSFRSASRQSVGGTGGAGGGTAFSTPKAGGTASRNGRSSIASGRMSVSSNYEMMPPPVSPSKYGVIGGRLVPGSAAKAEEVEKVNAALLEKIQELELQLELSLGGKTLEERDKAKKETEQRMKELSIASDFASREASTIRIELEEVRAARAQAEQQCSDTASRLDEVISKLTTTESTLVRTERDLKIQQERAAEELEKGMEIKRKEVRSAEERLRDMESQLHQTQLHVQELTEAGQMSIAILEKKVSDSQGKRFELESTLRQLEDKLTETEARARQLETPPSPSTAARRADTAATIDNENLKAQVAHQKDKINGLEDQLEELRSEKEALDATSAAAIAKSKDAEKRIREELVRSRAEVDSLKASATKAKSQITELEYAVKESKATLAHTQVEVETLRGEVGDLQNLRGAQTSLTKIEKERAQLVEDLASTKENLSARQAELDKLTRAFSELKVKHDLHLPYSDSPGGRNRDSTDSSGSRKPRMSNGMTDAEKSLRGFQHIIQDLSSENANLRQQTDQLVQDLDAMTLELADNVKDAAEKSQMADKLQEKLGQYRDRLKEELDVNEGLRAEIVTRGDVWAEDELAFMHVIESKTIQIEILRDEIATMEQELIALKPDWKRPHKREELLHAKEAASEIDDEAEGSRAPPTEKGEASPSDSAEVPSMSTRPVGLASDMCWLCGGPVHPLEECKMYDGHGADSPAAAPRIEAKGTMALTASPSPASAKEAGPAQTSPKEIEVPVKPIVATPSVAQDDEAPDTWCYNCSTSQHDDADCTETRNEDDEEVF